MLQPFQRLQRLSFPDPSIQDIAHDSHAVAACPCALEDGKRASGCYISNAAMNQGSKRAYEVLLAHERTVLGQEELQTSNDTILKAHEAQCEICSLNWRK